MINKIHMLYRIKKIFNMIRTGKKSVDDYDWKYYTDLYREGIEDVEQDHTQVLEPGDYAFENGTLILRKNIKPLHPNYHIVYETILQLNPVSVMEIGCGGGDHLHNLSILSPDIRLHGFDVSEGQVEFLKKRHPQLKAWISRYNIAIEPKLLDLPEVDIAYTQAVIMHIRHNHLNALTNLFRIAKKQIVLMENWKRHDFMTDIQTIFHEKKLPWDKLHFYYRESEATKKPHLMIVSAYELPQYPVLTDYRILSYKS
jgi:2-polyprenyl-3-methyl-5-hydroxy-6-metoxy-1,4-benzoquinol methylase